MCRLKNRYGGLQHDGPAVQLTGHQVDRRAGDFGAVLPCLPLRVHAGKRGEQRGVDVEDAVGKGVEKRAPEEPHEAGEADERHVAGAELADEDLFKGVAGRVVAVTDRQRRDAGGPRPLQTERVCLVRDHDRDLGLQASVGDFVDERLQIAAAP